MYSGKAWFSQYGAHLLGCLREVRLKDDLVDGVAWIDLLQDITRACERQQVPPDLERFFTLAFQQVVQRWEEDTGSVVLSPLFTLWWR